MALIGDIIFCLFFCNDVVIFNRFEMLLLFKDIQGHLVSLDGSGTHCYDFLLIIIIIITIKRRLISRGNMPGDITRACYTN